jgi:hypothetical protein
MLNPADRNRPAGFAIRSTRHHGDQLGGGVQHLWAGPIVAPAVWLSSTIQGAR